MDDKDKIRSDESVDDVTGLHRAVVWLRENKLLRATIRTLLLGLIAFGPMR